MVEITELVFEEINKYDHLNTKKQLIAGIVLTGGGAQLKHLKQLVEYVTGMDTRIGYPNEHLAGNSDPEITSPLYATAVGLVMNNLEEQREAQALEVEEKTEDVAPEQEAVAEETIEEITEETTARQKAEQEAAKRATISKKSLFSNLAEKFKEFLDNAE